MFMKKDFIVLGTTGVLLFGCGQSSQEPTSNGGYVKDVQVAAAVGATIDVTARDSADLAGTRLVISQGALARDTRITLQFQSPSIIAGNAVPAGPVAVWKPSGLTFSTPATLTLPFSLQNGQSARDLIVQVREEDGSYKTFRSPLLNVDVNAHLVTLPITGFSDFQAGVVVASTACSSDSDCGTASHCVDKVCVPGAPQPPVPPPVVCKSDADCPAGNACVDQRCVERPGGSGGSGTGGTGGTGGSAACASNADCPSDSHCVDRACVPGAPPPPQPPAVICKSNADCPAGNTCIDQRCVESPGGSGTGGTSGTGGSAACASNADCPSDSHCVDRACVPGAPPPPQPPTVICKSNADCPAGSTCVDQRCVP